MAEVYKFRCPDGQEFGWHGTPAALRKEHPDALILARQQMDEVGLAQGIEQGHWVPYDGKYAMPEAAEGEVGDEEFDTVMAETTPVDADGTGEFDAPADAEDVTTTTPEPKKKSK